MLYPLSYGGKRLLRLAELGDDTQRDPCRNPASQRGSSR
jgi:hypothetical protein